MVIPTKRGLYYDRYFIYKKRQMQFSPHFGHDDEEIEQVPSQFDSNYPNPSNYHETPQFSSNLTQRKLENVLTPKRCSNDQYFHKSEQFLNAKRQKIGSLKAEIEQKTMADCTFKPSINRSKSKNSRNLKQFLDSQANHQAKINEKTNTLKQRIEYENHRNMTFSPTINKKKHDNNKENVHERLYKLKDKERERDFHEVTYDHIPKITERGERIIRNLPVDELLYEDARRRADKQNNERLEPNNESVKDKGKNANIEKFAAQKFLKDFKTALISLNLQEKEELQEEDFNAILKTLGYSIYNSEQTTPLALEEHQLMRQAFTFLNRSGLSQASLFVFLLAIGGIYDVQIGEQTSIDEQQGKKIHNYFDTLFRNRLLNDYSKKIGRTPPRQQSPFKPTINPDSGNLAEKYRCKMIERANNIFAKNSIDIQIPDKGIAHGDLLVIYNLGQNLEKQKIREQKKAEKDPECTFQPNAQRYFQESHNQDIGAEKCHDLYEQAKARQAQVNKISTMQNFYNEQSKKKDVSPKASKVHKTSIPQPKSHVKSYLQIKDVDKTLARMAIGRQIRNQKRENQERGEKVIHKHDSRKRVSECFSRQREVLFDVDVSINGVNKKIFIYTDDRHRIPEVVAEFSHECGLDSFSQKTLEDQLMQAVAELPQGQEHM